MSNLACALTGVEGEQVALTDVSVSAVLRDLLSEVTVSQTYRNDEKVNIEAVYTFPLPLDAVLLELQVDIAGRVLKGRVVEKKEAEEEYEQATEAGDAAVMLEVLEPGLYTMNVGNLLPGEKATITFSYALLYRWAGDNLRLMLPTTIAPRYGESPHAPHQAPESSLTVENMFSLRVEIFGSLREAQFICPSHEVKLITHSDKVVINLQQTKAVMDRDFILNVKAPQTTRSFAMCGADGNDGLAAVASFQPFFPGLQQPRALNLAIVIDCSGSMQGDSIEQAKQALDGIIDALQPHDHVTLIGFGSTTKALAKKLLPCNKNNIEKAKRFANEMDADMGGTEIGAALAAAYKAMRSSEAADIFLVTDGEVSSWRDVVEEAKRSGHRIFTVGVGSSVSEAFVHELAAETGGECELVSPREGMANRVIRHFERMRAPRAKRVAIHWPEGAHDQAPAALGAVFQGDTVIASVRFARQSISGSVVLEVETEQGEVTRQELPISMPLQADETNTSTVARIAASARMKQMDEVSGLATAIQYRLVSPWTNWIVVAERSEEDKAQDIPALRKVPQTLAAGWGGAGMVQACLSAPPSGVLYCEAPSFSVKGSQGADLDAGDGPSKRHGSVPRNVESRVLASPTPQPYLPDEFRQLIDLIEKDPSKLDAKHAFNLMREAGLARLFDDLFRHAADLGLNVNAVAAILLARLLQGPLSKHLTRGRRHDVKSLQDYAEMAMETIIDMRHRVVEVMEVTQRAANRGVIDNEQARTIRDAIERLSRVHELLDHLKDRVQIWTEELVGY